jgi:hypothetical protein
MANMFSEHKKMANMFSEHKKMQEQGDAKNCDMFRVEVCPTIPFRDTL